MSKKILDVQGVNKSFGGLKALNEVVFDAVEGETHAIIGPNGAGKSTFLNVCIGKLIPDTGTVMFDGQLMTGKQPLRSTRQELYVYFKRLKFSKI